MTNEKTNENCVLLSLEYSCLLNCNLSSVYESSNGLWRLNGSSSGEMIFDNLYSLKQMINKLNCNALNQSNYIQIIEPSRDSQQLIKVYINGDQNFINNSRFELLSTYNQVNFKKINLQTTEFEQIKQNFLLKLNELSTYYNVEIQINNFETNFKTKFSHSDNYNVYIVGYQDNITIAESQVKILIDTLLNKFYLDSIDIPLSLIPIVGGINLLNFNEIVKQSTSNVYLPDLLPELFNSKMLSSNANLKIWITAMNVYEVIMTKKTINDLIETIMKNANKLVSKKFELTKAKLDLIVLHNQSDILNIMSEFGTFIQLPSLGEKNYHLTVQGQSVESVDETIRELSLLSSKYYKLEIINNDCAGNNHLSNSYFWSNVLHSKKTCLLTQNYRGVNIIGHKGEIKAVLQELAGSLPLEHYQINLKLELNNSQKDFISGKKNGKIIKIGHQLNQVPTISFHPFNEYNFFIKISIDSTNDRYSYLLKTIELIELELPAEVQFNIPEVFHKSIIGNGGSIIQSIMKKYNVFIKFSSSVNNNKKNHSVKGDEHEDIIFYSFKRFNNVLIKCPMKNSQNILLVKYEIDQLVTQCCLNNQPIKSANNTIYQTIDFKLLKSHYLMLINKKFNLKFINNLEIENNSFIDFPKSIDEFNGSSFKTIEIKGSELKSKQCANKLMKFLPNNYEFKFQGNFDELSADFKENITIPFRLLLGIELLVNESNHNGQACKQIILSYFGNEFEENPQMAINDLTLYLLDRNCLIMNKQPYHFNPIDQVKLPNTLSQSQPMLNYKISNGRTMIPNSPTYNQVPTMNLGMPISLQPPQSISVASSPLSTHSSHFSLSPSLLPQQLPMHSPVQMPMNSYNLGAPAQLTPLYIPPASLPPIPTLGSPVRCSQTQYHAYGSPVANYAKW